MKRSVQIFMFLWVFGAVSNSWALGFPGFTQLNTAVANFLIVLIGIVEIYLIVQLIFHFGLLHRGQPGEKEKVVMICFAIFVVPFVPAIGNYFYNMFFATGGSQSQAQGFFQGQ
jgi:hypothetical protein